MSMNTSTVTLSSLPRILRAMHATGIPVMLRGTRGLGKTMFLEQTVKSWGMGWVHESAPSQESTDLRGPLVPGRDDKGRGVGMWLLAPWLHAIEKQIAAGFTTGVLFFDEVPAATRDFRKALMALVSEGRIGEFTLPEGWVIWMAGNRTNDKAGADKLMAHEANKVAIFDVRPDMGSYVNWAIVNGVHPQYIAFAQVRPEVIFNENPPADPNQPTCTARTFTWASKFHQQFATGETELSLEADVVSGVAALIGPAASELVSFLGNQEFLASKAEIMADPLNCKFPPEERLDAHFAVAQNIVHISGDDDIDVEKLFLYMQRLRIELQVSCVKQMMSKGGGAVLNSPSLGQFIRNHRALIADTMMD